MDYAERLKTLRLENELTQSELAKRANLATSCIAMIESGKREPSAHTVISLANALSVTADYLLCLEDDFGVKRSASDSEMLTSEERLLLKDYRSLNFACKKVVKQVVETLKYSSGAADSEETKKSQ